VIDQELLNILDADTMRQDHNAELIGLLDLAMIPDKGETAVDDFAVELFKVLGYVRRQRLARTRVNFPLLICGEERHAKTDVCIVDLRMISFSLSMRTRGCSNSSQSMRGLSL
jgi:hypothetical protein